MQTAKQMGAKVGIVVGIFSVAMAAVWFMGGVQAKEIYEPQAPLAEKVYQTTLKANCEAERALASAKLLDVANNALELTPGQVSLLVTKKQTMTCDF